MFAQGRISAGVIHGLAEFMRARGLDLAELSARIGFDPDAPAHHETGFIPLEAFLWLLESGARETGDDAFGALFAEAHHLEATGLVYYIIEHAPTLRDSFRARVRFSQMVASSYSVTFVETEQHASFNWHFSPEMRPHAQFNDYAVTLSVERIRHFLGRDWQPQCVLLAHGPPKRLDEFHRLLGANIQFSKNPSGITIDVASLDKALPNANISLFRELERGADAIISSPAGQDFLQRASVLIAHKLPNGIPPIDEVANGLALSRRTLQRRLGDHRMNYRQLVDVVQGNMARHLLMETEFSLTEIALLLGFSEASSFSRAARIWLGETPMEFRQKNKVK